MMELLDEQPRGKQDYDMWISDGVALGKGKEDWKGFQSYRQHNKWHYWNMIAWQLLNSFTKGTLKLEESIVYELPAFNFVGT